MNSALVPPRAASGEVIRIDVPEVGSVSGLIDRPADPFCGCVLAHGAGAGMRHPFMEALAVRLVARGVGVLRFQFLSMERGQRRPDPPATAHAIVRAAVRAAHGHWPRLPLFAGGKSFGGRMTSQAQAIAALTGVHGLCFVGFPLHAAGSPSTSRADHLDSIEIPMLFLQGTRDALADVDLMSGVASRLPGADLALVDDADHAFHVRRTSGSTDEAVLDRLADTMTAWMRQVIDRIGTDA